MHYEEAGPEGAPVLVFLHGFLGDSKDWYKIFDLLTRDFRCMAFDLPGHGRSAKVRLGFTATRDAIVRQLDELGIRRFGLAGYSMGGRVALAAALAHGDRVSRAVIESASPGIADPAQRAARHTDDEKLAARLEAIASTEEFEAFLHDWYAQPLWHSLLARPELLDAVVARRARGNPVALGRALRALGTGAQPSLWDALHQAASPLLFLAGERDSKFLAIAEEMGARCPALRIRTVPGRGHNVHLEAPGEYAAHLRAFFSETSDNEPMEAAKCPQ
jgi:2-succinyl-6-hydroxy-2,4-cyclohexadiene-1-carboxylate synthase